MKLTPAAATLTTDLAGAGNRVLPQMRKFEDLGSSGLLGDNSVRHGGSSLRGRSFRGPDPETILGNWGFPWGEPRSVRAAGNVAMGHSKSRPAVRPTSLR